MRKTTYSRGDNSAYKVYTVFVQAGFCMGTIAFTISKHHLPVAYIKSPEQSTYWVETSKLIIITEHWQNRMKFDFQAYEY